jgi:predicted nucleic-acid-binding protein
VIGIDTNILVRIITRDDEKQSQIALDYVSNNSTPFVINHIVICELVWVLESAYKYDKKQIIKALECILKVKQFLILEKNSVRSALKLYAETSIDFSDALIGYVNKEEGCEFTITFDKATSKTSIYKLL